MVHVCALFALTTPHPPFRAQNRLRGTPPGDLGNCPGNGRGTHICETVETRCTPHPLTTPLFPLASGRTSISYVESWSSIRSASVVECSNVVSYD